MCSSSRAAPEPPLLGGLSALPGLLPTPCVWGHPEGRPSEAGSGHRQQAAFLTTLTASSPTPRPQKKPLGPCALALPGRSLLRPGPSLLTASWSPGAPTAQGRLSAVLGRPMVSGARSNRFLWGLPLSTAASTHLPPSLLWMGPGGFKAPLCAGSHLPALPMGESLLLCACCTEGCSFTHLPGAQGSAGQAPPRVRGSPGQVHHRSHPGTEYRALIAEHPQSTFGQV